MKNELFLIIFMMAIGIQMAQQKIIYMAELFRHGARYPVSDIYDGKDTKPFHGKLTGVGMRQQYNLGSYLKKDYLQDMKLSSTTLNPRQVEMFTDGSQRCFFSAYAQLAGLFQLNYGAQIPQGIDSQFLMPPYEESKINSLQIQDQIDQNGQFALFKGYQPVPVLQNPAYFPQCKEQAKWIQRRAQQMLPKVLQLQAEHLPFTIKIKQIFKLKAQYQNLAGLIQLYDVITCDINLGRKMPQAFTAKQYRELEYIQNYMFILLYQGKYDKVMSTPIASNILTNMEKVIAGKLDDKKITLISGHDTNVAPMLSFFNLSSPQCIRKRFRNESVTQNCGQPVPFASNLIFQLHIKDNQMLIQEEDKSNADNYYIKIRYNGDYYDVCQKKSKECNFVQFSQRVKRQLVNFDHQCGNK